jgi:hypothetical protein
MIAAHGPDSVASCQVAFKCDCPAEWGAPPPDLVIAHTNLYWTYETAPGRTAGTVATRDVDFGGTS